jgi:hypothetical protein
MIGDALADHLDVVFDLTVGYSGLDAEDIPYEEYLIDKVFFSGYYPKEIHINVKKIALHSIPGLNTEDTGNSVLNLKDGFERVSKVVSSPVQSPASSKSLQPADVFDARSNERRLQLSEWLKDLFMDKDHEMKLFYEKKCFPGSSVSIELSPTIYDWVIVLSIGACSWIILPFWFHIFKAVFSLLYRATLQIISN